MKLFGFAMVKNEADIIESFVRINSLVLDEIHIIDDGSTDETITILTNLKNEGYNITIHFHNLNEVQQQSLLMSSIVKEAQNLGWDFAFLLDADEFLIHERKAIESDLGSLKGTFFGLMEWLTFIPVEPPNNEPRTLHNSYKARPKEAKNSYNYKVVIPNNLVSDQLNITVGNHGVLTSKPTRETHVILKTRLAHIPVRSANQIIRKAILGSHTLSIKNNRLPRESAHWEITADAIRKKNFILSIEDLQQIAFGNNPEDYHTIAQLLNDPKIPDVGKLKYTKPDNADNPLYTLKAFDSYCSELCRRIRSFSR